MPLLSIGTFSVQVTGVNSSFIHTMPIRFQYYPFGLVIWTIVGCFWWWAYRAMRGNDAFIFSPRHYALIPGIIGVLHFFLNIYRLVYFAIPLQVHTIILLIWRWRKVKSWIQASVWILVTSLVLTYSNFYFSVLPDGTEIGMPGFILSLIIAVPLIVIRLAVRNGVTGRSISRGFGLGVLLPFAVLSIFYAAMSFPPEAYIITIGYLLLITIPFCILIRWNQWARETVEGKFPEPTKPESPLSPFQYTKADVLPPE